MTDIVERLRGWGDGRFGRMMTDAADEIERLRAKNRELASSLATLLMKKDDEIERLRAENAYLRCGRR